MGRKSQGAGLAKFMSLDSPTQAKPTAGGSLGTEHPSQLTQGTQAERRLEKQLR